MTTQWFQIDPSQLPAGIIVIDATSESAPLWYGPVLSVLEDLAARLEGSPSPEVVFLGGSQRHALADVLRGIDPRGRTPGNATPILPNLGRGPVVGPVLRWANMEPPQPVLLITTVCPLDLDDWVVPAEASPLAVYRLTGDTRLCPPHVNEWTTDIDLGVVADFLRDPAVRVVCGGNGIPIGWDADGWRWDRGRLVADGPSPNKVRVAVTPPVLPRATAVRASGAVVDLAVKTCDPVPDPDLVRLTPAEDAVLDLWQQGVAFWCGGCARSHPPGQVRCEAGAEGSGLLATLGKLPGGTVCVLTRAGVGWSAVVSSNAVLPDTENRVILWTAPRPTAFERQGEEWVPGNDPGGQFLPIAGGGYAVRV